MKRILIYKNITKDLECNINTHYPNSEIFEKFELLYKNGAMPNTGNKIWFQAIVNEVSNGNEVAFLTENMTCDFINNYFDIIIYPMANIFGEQYKDALNNIGDYFKNIKIPTFIISCGIQAKNESEIPSLCKKIEYESKKFITNICQRGGGFALRGFKTDEFFRKLGFNNAAVVGCPSLYQKGENLSISNTKISKEQFKVIINGNLADYDKSCFSKNCCTFVDQDTFVHPLFNKDFCSNIIKNHSEAINAIKYYGFEQLLTLFSGNVQLFFETNLWYNHIVKNDYSFSFGSRIHGNIMSILSGVPTLINAKDIRVKEMAELYNIPYIKNKHIDSVDELYELYLQTDYTNFNNNYNELYNNFKSFLINNQIVEMPGAFSEYFELPYDEFQSISSYPTEIYFSDCYKLINKFSLIFKIINKLK